MIHPTIYKRTATGAIQIWYAETDGGRYRTVSGQIDGVKQVSEWTQCETKNPGKRNEILPAAQAEKEVAAMYVKQLRKDYHSEIANIDNIARVKPSLAERYADVCDSIDDDEPFEYQPKLDGFRCLATPDIASLAVALSGKEGLPITTVPHIVEALHTYLPGIPADGELFNYELRHDFNKISSMLRKENPTAAQAQQVRELVKYYVYDIQLEGVPRWKRREILRKAFQNVPPDAPLVLVEWEDGVFADFPAYLRKHLANQHEGAMGRPLNGLYLRRRTKALIKIKQFDSAEYRIIDILPGVGKHAELAASIVMSKLDGTPFADGKTTFNVGPLGDHAYLADLLANKAKYINSPGEVSYPNLTPAGKPRFGKLKQVRFFD